MPGDKEVRIESVAERRRHIAVERLGHVVLHIVENPSGRDDRDVRGRAPGNVGREALLEIVPAHVLDVDLDVGMFGLEALRRVLEGLTRVIAIVRDDDVKRCRREGWTCRAEAQCCG